MSYLPISLNIEGKKIVIIGGGRVALQKVKNLIQFTNNITVISPDVKEELNSYGINVIIKEYNSDDIKDAFMVYACTDDTSVNNKISDDADKLNILCNRTDEPDKSDFISSAITQDSKFRVSVNSTDRDKKSTIKLRNRIKGLLKRLEIYREKRANNRGKVFLVGFGPGNPDLMTIRANDLCHEADIIFYDDLLDCTSLDKYGAEKVYVGKRRGNHHKNQDEINEVLYQAAKQGKMVVRLKGGDPLIFGRGSEEKMYLEERGISAEIIPGITSAIAAAAYSGIPLTHRGVSSSVAFGTAHGKSSYKLLESDTSVYYMGAKNILDVAKKYLDSGYPEDYPVAIVHNASMPDQEVLKTNISELLQNKFEIKSPIISIFGNTVNYQNIVTENRCKSCNKC